MSDRLTNHVRYDDSEALYTLALMARAFTWPHYERDRPEHPFRGMTSPGYVDWHDVLPGVLAFARRVDDRNCADDIRTEAHIHFPAGLRELPPTFATATSAYGMSTLAFNRGGDTWIVSKDDRNDTGTVEDRLAHDRMHSYKGTISQNEQELWDRRREQTHA